MALTKIGDAGMPAGSVLQVVQTSVNTSVSASMSGESTFVDISGMSVSITPASTSSKILVSYSLNLGHSVSDQNNSVRLMRDTTAIVGSGGSTANVTNFCRNTTAQINEVSTQYLDSPSTTSAVTYKVQWASGSGTFYLNSRGGGTQFVCVSTITVMEIAG